MGRLDERDAVGCKFGRKRNGMVRQCTVSADIKEEDGRIGKEMTRCGLKLSEEQRRGRKSNGDTGNAGNSKGKRNSKNRG